MLKALYCVSVLQLETALWDQEWQERPDERSSRCVACVQGTAEGDEFESTDRPRMFETA